MIAASAKAVEVQRRALSKRSALFCWLHGWQQVIIAELLVFLAFRRAF